MWIFVLSLFCLLLFFCIIFNFSILYALVLGLFLFLFYGKHRGLCWRELFVLCFMGIKTVKNILITFLLIGVLTALWRCSGTISVIVCFVYPLIKPASFFVMTFLLNCCVSMLTGTAFGTAATMGGICGVLATSMGIDINLVGGAVLSGAFFGDRCSPVSTSALLVSALTKTDIFENIKNMFKTCLVPFILSCLIYGLMGIISAKSKLCFDLKNLFLREFSLHWIALLPAIVILILSILKVSVKKSMTASIVCAIFICLFLQKNSFIDLLKTCIYGFKCKDAEIAKLLNGGGIISMFKVAGIVCLSSVYSPIFQRTNLLDEAKKGISLLANKTSKFFAILITSVVMAMISCNQSLAIMLTNQLCKDLRKSNTQFANDLEDSVVVVSPLVPWSIASGVPLGSVNAEPNGILFAYYLYLLPIWRTLTSFKKSKIN